jgi:hypothetical protein
LGIKWPKQFGLATRVFQMAKRDFIVILNKIQKAKAYKKALFLVNYIA